MVLISKAKEYNLDNLPTYSAIKKQFCLELPLMRQLVSEFIEELISGLKGEPSSFPMLPSFIHALPTGFEKGEYYALDFGGTNFRATKFRFDGSGRATVLDEHKVRIPDDIRVSDTPNKLFDFFVRVLSSLEISGDISKTVGFTFSFPIKQKSINSGDLMSWTKGFNIGGVVDNDVVVLFSKALKRFNLENYKINVLINDTVGTLASGKYKQNNCVIGLILGTGTNAAYVEKTCNIHKLSENEKKHENMVINVEWGAFGDLKNNLPQTIIDKELDNESTNKGQQQFEKMISGYYLGEIVRRIIILLKNKNELFIDINLEKTKLVEKYSLGSEYVSILDLTNIEKNLNFSFERFEKEFKFKILNEKDKFIISNICTFVSQRAAKLTGIGIVGLLSQIHSSQYENSIPGVGIDGSLFEQNKTFKVQLKTTLDELDTKCELFLAKDGSGKGAALLASALESLSYSPSNV